MREQALGRHLIVEVWDADPRLLDDVKALEHLLVKAAQAAQATVIESVFHHFSPYGVSGVVVIAESHLTIHTWPEYGYAAIDIFTCGPKMDLDAAVAVIRSGLKGRTFQIEISRGQGVRPAHSRSVRNNTSRVFVGSAFP